MQRYQHQIFGIFQGPWDAHHTFALLQTQGISATQMQIAPTLLAYPGARVSLRDHPMLTHLMLQGAVGGSIGFGLALLIEAWLVFMLGPVWLSHIMVTTLTLLIAGISLGMTLGAMTGAMTGAMLTPASLSPQIPSRNWLDRLLVKPNVLLSVNTFSTSETAIATAVIQASVHHYHDIRII